VISNASPSTMLHVLLTISFTVFAQTEPNPPDWPSSVHVFSEGTRKATMEAAIAEAWKTNGGMGKGEPHGQFSKKRYAFLFAPGEYDIDVPVGYYTQVLGLGESPEDVRFTGWFGPYVPCNFSDPHGPGSLDTFWRSGENFLRDGSMIWSVSQAAPLRRVHVKGDLHLVEKKCWASGGYVANSHVEGTVHAGGQQQWFTRNSNLGAWHGSGWNVVFVGTQILHGGWHGNVCGVAPYQGQSLVIDEAPVAAEKPFISLVRNSSKFMLNIPSTRRHKKGTVFTLGSQVPFERVFVARPGDTASLINSKLWSGLHVVVTPGIYVLDRPLKLKHHNQVLLCIGIATLKPMMGNAVIEVDANAGGVRVSGCMIEAGDVNSPVLLQWGSDSHAGDMNNPGFMHDVFVRVGGETSTASATTMVQINSSYVVGDHLWLWRADHYDSGNYTEPVEDALTMLGENDCAHGLVVAGNHVTMYGLQVEHMVKDQVIWSGENGECYFYQCEIPYDVTKDWSTAGYAAYRVSDGVVNHSAYGLGVYSFFRDFEVWMDTAIKTPPAVSKNIIQPMITFLSGKGGIKTILNGKGSGVHGKFGMQFLNNDCVKPGLPPSNEGTPGGRWIYFLLPLLVLAVLLGLYCKYGRHSYATFTQGQYSLTGMESKDEETTDVTCSR